MEEVNVQLDEFKKNPIQLLGAVEDIVIALQAEVGELKDALKEAEESAKDVEEMYDDKVKEYDKLEEEYAEFQDMSIERDSVVCLKIPHGGIYDNLNIALLEELLPLPYEKLLAVVKAKREHPIFKQY